MRDRSILLSNVRKVAASKSDWRTNSSIAVFEMFSKRGPASPSYTLATTLLRLSVIASLNTPTQLWAGIPSPQHSKRYPKACEEEHFARGWTEGYVDYAELAEAAE